MFLYLIITDFGQIGAYRLNTILNPIRSCFLVAKVSRNQNKGHGGGMQPLFSTPSDEGNRTEKKLITTNNGQGKDSRSKRQRVGRPQRKSSVEGSFQSGRVSVYCVGASIDLQTLRAHVFRRGFTKGPTPSEKPDLVLTRGEVEDDGVLHISNAPLFITTESLFNSNKNYHTEESDFSIQTVSGEDEERVDMEMDLEAARARTRDAILMSTQDIFYFDFGCVVFWGLNSMEEQAALTELAEFTEQPSSASELDDR
jgi:uncharacterized Rmd1/YagE family protein